jgi:heme-binding protein
VTRTVTTLRRGLLAVFACSLLGGVALVMPSASAQPDDCSASGLASTVSSVTKSMADYLAAHPETNQALLDITRQPPMVAVGQIDGYFNDHPKEADELRALQQPATAYQNRCGMQVEPSQALYALLSL